MGKLKPSSVKAFAGTVEGLCLIESSLRKTLKECANSDDEEMQALFVDTTRLYIRVAAECRELLAADIKAQRDFQELMKAYEAGMVPAEVEASLEAHMVRKGWGNLEAARSMLFLYLTEEGLTADQANEVIENGLPKREARSRQLPVMHKIRKAYSRLEDTLSEGATALSEALAPSEGPDSGDDQGTTTAPDKSDSDEEDT